MKSPKSKTRLKRAHILPLIVLGVVALLAAALFGGWYLRPSHPLDIAVLDKTVPASAADADDPVLGYRKHYGLFWMLNQRKITNPLTGRAYDAAADYYGTLLQEGTDPVNNSMARLDRTPDMVYLADAYGGETDGETAGDKGLCYADLAAAATAYHNGATLVAETDLFADATEDAVQTELRGLLGITSTGWTGRYITDMSDLSDVPEWAQSLTVWPAVGLSGRGHPAGVGTGRAGDSGERQRLRRGYVDRRRCRRVPEGIRPAFSELLRLV